MKVNLPTKALLVILLSMVSANAAQDSGDFVKGEQEWRERRQKRLTSEDGWLTLIGLHWLKEGENRFGSDPSNEIVLPESRTPKNAGFFTLKDGNVRLEVADRVQIERNGSKVQKMDLRPDVPGPPDILNLGDLTFYVVKRGNRLGVRIKDPKSSARTSFKGIPYYPPKPEFRVEGTFVPHSRPEQVSVKTVIGVPETMTLPGLVKFRVQGKELSIEAFLEDPKDTELFYIFRDETSGKETYPSGRFMYSEMPKDGKVILNFNRAYNPPCAFTRYSTCPLPPPQNWLPVRIEAGEKNYKSHP